MYGFFNPKGSHLSKEEMRIFKAYYCRVCYCLQNVGGQTARFFTTYDMALFSIVLHLTQKYKRPEYFRCQKIGSSVMRHFSDDNLGKRLACMSIIVFGEKIRDDEIDGNKARAAFMNLLYKKTAADARTHEPQIAEYARKGASDIDRLQNENAPLDVVLSRYGKMITDMFSCVAYLTERAAFALSALAIWTFYMDMLADYDSDYRKKAYNGFYKDGVSHISDRFDEDYVYFLKINREIASMLRSAVEGLRDSSGEWSVLNKITEAALSSAARYAVLTKKEKRRMKREYLCKFAMSRLSCRRQ